MSLLTSLVPLPYRIAAVAVLVLAIAGSSFAYGKHYGDLRSAQTLAAFTAQKNAEEANLLGLNTLTNTKIVTEVVTKVVHIHDQGVTNANLAKTSVPDRQLLSAGWVYLHDVAATGDIADPTSAADGTPSTTPANQALVTVVNNYATCRVNTAKLVGLQTWVNDTNANITAANKKRK